MTRPPAPPHTPDTAAPHTTGAGAADRPANRPGPTPGRPGPALTTGHRVLVAVVATGTTAIAGIGFAGSYTAVRELAARKGFGTFSSLFPIGIDAGICVLLALDLLLTWIRIPFPLLRQTAWLLTAATIAFNAATAWPDPLGTAMHAVTPILFVVAVEAARHAIGRIADITADTHMEGVRITRWFLSPAPTFLLWRRMKLWELRSYDQVIKLEQERLVYQARLRTRFGRAWRRKAPVESLIPLRLARYGIPLTETAPAALAAMGTDAPVLVRLEQVTTPDRAEDHAPGAGPDRPLAIPPEGEESAPQPAEPPCSQDRDKVPERPPDTRQVRQHAAESVTQAYQEFLAQPQAEPAATGKSLRPGDPSRIPDNADTHDAPDPFWDALVHSAWVGHDQDRGAHPDAAAPSAHTQKPEAWGADGGILTDGDQAGFIASFHQQEPSTGELRLLAAEGASTQENRKPLTRAEPETATARAASAPQGLRPDALVGELPPAPGGLSVPDRYYLAWMEYQDQKGREPSDEELSAYCARKGLLGRGGNPVSPANLRRHFVRWRVYNVWAQQRHHTTTPAPTDIAQACTHLGITAQYNKPITPAYVIEATHGFEHRWHTLTRHHTGRQA
ncbi:DUF2637 domain-containing protein [Streptomyces sp. NPDC005811]|uniref:DUF2637 domain-containing protein n=1 Tax=Streptomyces sp. NPDC005811 TaxID=3154565 RepID=UPI0033E4F8FB